MGAIIIMETDKLERMILSTSEIDELIRKETKKYPDECRDIEFGAAYWHEPDESECNWDIRSARGSDIPGCRDRVAAFVTRLRERYNVPNPTEIFEYRSCRIRIEAIPERHPDGHGFVPTWAILQGAQLRKHGTSAEALPTPEEALARARAFGVQDAEDGFSDGWLT